MKFSQIASKLVFLATVSFLFAVRPAEAGGSRNGRINTRSAIDDYMEFHGPRFSTESTFRGLESPSEKSVKSKASLQAVHSHKSPVVGQEEISIYDGYTVREEPFSSTDSYQYALQFKIGAKLDQNYQYVDECFDAWVHIFDDVAYYKNNITDVGKEIQYNLTNNWWFSYLNFTGIMFGPVADIMVECYRFGNSIYDYEEARFIQFNEDWGDFFLAFLFNQMGNALYFQAKFERIQDFTAKQSYQSIWLEYGDLLYLVWDFDPLPESSYDSIEGQVLGYMNEFAEKFSGVDEETNEFQRAMVQASAPVAAKALKEYGNQIDKTLKSTGKEIRAFFDGLRVSNRAKPFNEATKLQTNVWGAPWSIPAFNMGTSVATSDLASVLYGILNGAIDVFPYSSNPNRCRNNITQSYDSVQNWINWDYDIVASEDDRLTFFKEMSYLIQLPFGVCYSCYWGFGTILLDHDPWEDGVLTEDEELEMMITLGHDIPTNLFYNIGYIYGDLWSMYSMNDGTNLYWEKFGRYLGDATIRIFWRRQFTRNFDYDIDDDEDD